MALPHRAIAAAIVLLYLLAACREGQPPLALTEARGSPAAPAATSAASGAGTQVRALDGMTMILVPGGTFSMGSTEADIEDAISLCQQHYGTCNRWYYEREGPRHPVTLDGFWIDQTEVTNAQYRRCVEAGACSEPLTCAKGEPTYADPDRSNHPVVCVSWEEAQAYCTWAGGRLPTEAEWEYAARGTDGLIYPWGNAFDGTRLDFCDANCAAPHADQEYSDGYARTAPADSYPQGASWSGALGMGGNVSEWVADWLGEYSSGALLNPAGPASGSERMIKGCSWFAHPTYCRGAARASANPDTRFDYLGFRCAVSRGGTNAMPVTTIPRGNPPTLDGTLMPGEWDGARRETFADGSELHLMQGEGYLYVGIRANTPGMIVGNVFVNRGAQVAVLHASAALGTAVYERGRNNWQMTRGFSWCCRDTGDGEAARAERAAFLEQEGWMAATSPMGAPEEMEYRIQLTGDTLRLAVTFIRASDPNVKIAWPASLHDDCVRPTPSGFPAELAFSPEQWATLTVTRPGELVLTVEEP